MSQAILHLFHPLSVECLITLSSKVSVSFHFRFDCLTDIVILIAMSWMDWSLKYPNDYYVVYF